MGVVIYVDKTPNATYELVIFYGVYVYLSLFLPKFPKLYRVSIPFGPHLVLSIGSVKADLLLVILCIMTKARALECTFHIHFWNVYMALSWPVYWGKRAAPLRDLCIMEVWKLIGAIWTMGVGCNILIHKVPWNMHMVHVCFLLW